MSVLNRMFYLTGKLLSVDLYAIWPCCFWCKINYNTNKFKVKNLEENITLLHPQIPVKLQNDLGNQRRLWAMLLCVCAHKKCACIHVCLHLAFSYLNLRGEQEAGLLSTTCVWNKKSIQAIHVWPPTDWAVIFTQVLWKGVGSLPYISQPSPYWDAVQLIWIIYGIS